MLAQPNGPRRLALARPIIGAALFTIRTRPVAVSIDQMSNRFTTFARFAFFALIALFLFWLGTVPPKVTARGPGLVMTTQGSNMVFVPQNSLTTTWSVTSASAVTNLSLGTRKN